MGLLKALGVNISIFSLTTFKVLGNVISFMEKFFLAIQKCSFFLVARSSKYFYI